MQQSKVWQDKKCFDKSARVSKTGTRLLERLAAVLGADVAGAVAAALGVKGLPKVRQQHRPPALHLFLAVRHLRMTHSALSGGQVSRIQLPAS